MLCACSEPVVEQSTVGSAVNANNNQQLKPEQRSAHALGIVVTSIPERPPINDYFKLDIRLNAPKYAEIKAKAIRVEAIMPAHQHGMNVEPIIKPHLIAQRFTAEGLIFHMRGRLAGIYLYKPS